MVEIYVFLEWLIDQNIPTLIIKLAIVWFLFYHKNSWKRFLFSMQMIFFPEVSLKEKENIQSNYAIYSKYTERLKRNITFFRAPLTKIQASKQIIFGHRLAIILLTKHISKNKCLLESKRNNVQWNCKRTLFKNHRNCSLPGNGVWHVQKHVRQLHNLPLKLSE